MKKKIVILYVFINFIFIYLISMPVKSSETVSNQESGEIEEEEKTMAGAIDIGYITGTITGISEDGKEIKIITDNETAAEKSDCKVFTVQRQGVPIAIVEASNKSGKESLLEIKEILEGITLKAGDKITSEASSLDRRDLKILDNPYCELISKTLIGGEGQKARWHLQPLYIDITGDAYLFTCYGNPKFSGVGSGSIGWFSGHDYSFMYLFNSNGEKKWGFYTELCIFKDFDMSFTPFDWGIKFTHEEKPDYKIYSDKLYLNCYNITPDLWVPRIIKANGHYFSLDIKTGKELWRLKDGTGNYSPAFYGVNYDNFTDKISYYYSTKPAIYGVDIANGKFLWEFEMKEKGMEKLIFNQEDKSVYASDEDGYFYKIDGLNGKEIWNIKLESKIMRTEICKDEKSSVLYLFDERKTIIAINPATGAIIWKYEAEKPFTSPKGNQIIDNLIYTFDESSITIIDRIKGTRVWKYDIKKPAPAFFDKGLCYCMSGNKNLCAIDINQKHVLWSYEVEKEITGVLTVRNIIYILDKNNIYLLDKASGKEICKKTDFPEPVYLESYEIESDPYSIMNLGAIKQENQALFIRGEKGFVSINNQISCEKTFNENFFVVIGDENSLYIASKKYIWALDKTTGILKWEKNFEEPLSFLVPPEGGKVYYADEDYNNEQRTINSSSKVLLGLKSGESFYFLNKNTGEIINQGKEEETLFPYLEIEAMNKAGEKKEGVYFYCYKDSLYTFRSKIVSSE